MIVDTSAVVAIVNREPGFEAVLAAIEAAPVLSMSTVSMLELTIVLGSARFGLSADVVAGLLTRLRIEAADFSALHVAVAADAYRRFGKGNHPARLNFGDCASYAAATLASRPLLFVGDDFTRTDVVPAL